MNIYFLWLTSVPLNPGGPCGQTVSHVEDKGACVVATVIGLAIG